MILIKHSLGQMLNLSAALQLEPSDDGQRMYARMPGDLTVRIEMSFPTFMRESINYGAATVTIIEAEWVMI